MRSIGRLLQIIGLVLLPLFIGLELTNQLGRDTGVAELLLAMVFGLGLFYVGRIVEGFARGSTSRQE